MMVPQDLILEGFMSEEFHMRVCYGAMRALPTGKDMASLDAFRRFVSRELDQSRSGQVRIEIVTGDPWANDPKATSTTISKDDAVMPAEGRNILIEQMYAQYQGRLNFRNHLRSTATVLAPPM
jgi:hypothetical protein